GSRDAGMVASECPHGSMHINAEGFHVEVIGPSGDRGELVVTNFNTPAMPIIRYRTQDVGTSLSNLCRCGRTLPLLGSVDGRRTDFLITPDGRVLHALSVIYILREVRGIEEFRVNQESIDRLIVNIVPGPAFGSAQEVALREALGRLMGPTVKIEIIT